MDRRIGGLLIAGVLAMSGCGGGGDDLPATATTTGGSEGAPAVSEEQIASAVEGYREDLRDYAGELRSHARGKLERRALTRLGRRPPQLEALETDDPEYAQARASAADVDALAGELAVVAGSTDKADDRLYSRLYDASQDAEARELDLNEQNYDRLSPVLYRPSATTRRAERLVHRTWYRYMADEIDLWERHDRRLAAIPARSELHRSFVAFQRATADEAIAFARRFRTHLRDTPLPFLQYGYYTAQAVSFPLSELPATVMWEKDKQLIRGFVRGVGRIARGGEAPVGDPYRSTILRGFVSPTRQADLRHVRVTEQLWMLWRIRELEDTPDDVYEDARQTILLQTIDDARSPYDRMLEVYEESGDDLEAGRREIRPRMEHYLEWAHTELARPTAPALEPLVRALDRGLERFPKVERRRIFATSDAVTRAANRIERQLKRGTRRLDDARRLKAATRGAIEATQPER